MSDNNAPRLPDTTALATERAAKNEFARQTIRQKFFDTLHHNYRPYPRDKTLHEIFQENAAKHPHNIAISLNSETLSYQQLNEKSNQLARYIRSQYTVCTGTSLPRNTPIAIFLDRSIEMIISILAILKAGATYSPIDSKSPEKRIGYVLADTACPLVITQSTLLKKLSCATAQHEAENGENSVSHPIVVNLDEVSLATQDTDNIHNYSKAHDLAYIIYTSGTTGKPKGVMIEHHSVINLAFSRQYDYHLDNSSIILQFSPIAFDSSVCEIFSALINGARLSIIDEQTKRDPLSLVEYMRSEKVSIATVLPSLLSQLSLLETPDLPDLKTLIVAGEACTQDVISRWRRGRDLIIGYGPTETTVCATLSPYKQGDLPTIIGSPIQNTCIYILDEQLKPVATGETGELYVSGVSLARGYWNRPDITGERFLDNPFVSEMDKENGFAKMYKTGDLAKWCGDGRIEYIGRNDFQVKIRGHRIELGEIETALLNYPDIKQVCVLARDRSEDENNTITSPGTNKYLVVYYLANQEVPANRFIEHLSATLPEYMIPSYFVQMDAFPLTANEKIDRRALPHPDFAVEHGEVMPPQTEMEQQLFSIWESVLGIEQFGIQSDFFKIGGTSLLVVSLVAFINARFNIKINASMIGEHKTITAQSALIQEKIQEMKSKQYTSHFQAITAFQPLGNKPPLFFIHPSMSGAEPYRIMTNGLDADQPFFGVESYNFNHMDTPERELRALAARYTNYIKESHPQGPYCLGGYSSGGILAYEIADQLIRSEEQVIGLYLIDSVLPKTPKNSNFITSKHAIEYLEYFRFNPADKRLLELAKTEIDILLNYFPKSILPIKLVLFKAMHLFSPVDGLPEDHVANYFFQPDDNVNNWDNYFSEVKRFHIDANHETIIEPHKLQEIARIIQQDINALL